MRTIIPFILIILVYTGCNNSNKHSNRAVSEQKQYNITNREVVQEQELTIKDITDIIDSVYKTNSYKPNITHTDSINRIYESSFTIMDDDDSISKESTYKVLKHPLYAFYSDKSEYLYKYSSFSVLQFKTDTATEQAFRKIYNLFTEQNLRYKFTADSIRLYYDVFSKGGCIYIRKDNFIIHRYRKCNDNYKENEKKEAALIKYLYGKEEVKESCYFMRFCCSCPQNKISEYR